MWQAPRYIAYEEGEKNKRDFSSSPFLKAILSFSFLNRKAHTGVYI